MGEAVMTGVTSRGVSSSTTAERVATMKAAVHIGYGPDKVEVRDVPRPELVDDGVLVRVRASSLNRADWYGATGMPLITRQMQGWRRPKDPRFGIDFAGTVEAVGTNVAGFRPGDDVFGRAAGALAEYVCASAGGREGFSERQAIALKPPDVSFEEAAAVPVAGVTALQALRDKGNLQAGQRVLVNGASGGVGTFAVQIAKAFGAEVTAVCSTGKVDLVRSLGADQVVDYTREDFTRSGRRYDLMIDVAGSRSWHACTRVLEPDATVVLVGGPSRPVFGPLAHIGRFLLAGKVSNRKVVFFVAKIDGRALETLVDLLTSGKLKPTVERTYPLADLGDALRYVGTGHVHGKVVVVI